LRDKYDVRILCMSRKLKDHARSTQNMWKRSRDSKKRNATIQQITKHIQDWTLGVRVIRRSYTCFPYLNVSFDALVAQPYKVTKEICNFIDMPIPEPEVVTNWIDRKLVNRKSL